MIDRAIYEHLSQNSELAALLTSYAGKPAIFNQDAPPDTDPLWSDEAQYGRVVFALDVLGDPARGVGGTLAVDVYCVIDKQQPENIEPVVRTLIDGYFFSDEGCTMAAGWVDSRYFSEPARQVCGVTLTFSLLAFPKLSTLSTDVIASVNEWTDLRFPELLVINRDELPAVWKPETGKCAAYWRLAGVAPAEWIPDTHQTIWRCAILKCHVFAPDIYTAFEIAQKITLKLYCDQRIMKQGESPIMINRMNSVDTGADALREGQVTVEAAFGEIIKYVQDKPLNHINYT